MSIVAHAAGGWGGVDLASRMSQCPKSLAGFVRFDGQSSFAALPCGMSRCGGRSTPYDGRGHGCIKGLPARVRLSGGWPRAGSGSGSLRRSKAMFGNAVDTAPRTSVAPNPMPSPSPARSSSRLSDFQSLCGRVSLCQALKCGSNAFVIIRVSASPRLRVSASPRLRVSASPRLRVSASPRLRVSASPRLRVSASPRLRVSASPRLRVSASPRLRVSASASQEPETSV